MRIAILSLDLIGYTKNEIDTARALVERLNRANPLTLGLTGVTDLANSSREVLTSLTSSGGRR